MYITLCVITFQMKTSQIFTFLTRHGILTAVVGDVWVSRKTKIGAFQNNKRYRFSESRMHLKTCGRICSCIIYSLLGNKDGLDELITLKPNATAKSFILCVFSLENSPITFCPDSNKNLQMDLSSTRPFEHHWL